VVFTRQVSPPKPVKDFSPLRAACPTHLILVLIPWEYLYILTLLNHRMDEFWTECLYMGCGTWLLTLRVELVKGRLHGVVLNEAQGRICRLLLKFCEGDFKSQKPKCKGLEVGGGGERAMESESCRSFVSPVARVLLSELKDNVFCTPSPCFTPFYFNAPYQFTPFLNLRPQTVCVPCSNRLFLMRVPVISAHPFSNVKQGLGVLNESSPSHCDWSTAST
jgi:hypothetical protein